MNRSRNVCAAGLLALLLLAHVILFSALPLTWRTFAALWIAAFSPGILVVEWLIGRPDAGAIAARGLYALGAGYAILVGATLLASYLPGGLNQTEMLLIFDGLTVVLFGLWWWKPQAWLDPRLASRPAKSTSRWWLAAWISLLLVGGFFRMTDLGYSEFQSDEASPALRAVAVVQGNEDVLFLHKKGPTEILIPAAMLALTGHMTEASGRLPFALANLGCLLAVFVLGWQVLNPLAGWIAALLLALDGYYIGYAHMLQYQSILFLMTPLVVLLLYGLVKALPPSSAAVPAGRGAALSRHLLLAALFVTTGLLSHYDGVLVFLPGLYLLWMLVRRGVPLAQLGRAVIIPIIVSALLLGSFYLPFVLHPHFQETYTYYATHVIGTSQWLYNHLVEFADQATLFNTVYAFWMLVGVTSVALVLLYWRSKSGWPGHIWALLVILVSLLAIFAPDRLLVGQVDLMPWLFGLVLCGAWFMPRLTLEDRLLWLWFGLPLFQALFLTKAPSAHFHVLIVPWLLIVGQTLAWLWRQCRVHLGERVAIGSGVGLALLAIVLFGSYAQWFYLDHAEVARYWQETARPHWWPLHASLDGQPLFGLPHNSGWKTIGMLYQTGTLRGSYEANIRPWASDWYTRGAEYCENRARYVFLELSRRRDKQAEFHSEKRDQYQLFGTIYVQNEPRLEIYQRDAVTLSQRFAAEDYVAPFDSQLSGTDFRLGPPTVDPVMTPIHYQLGEQIKLVGYRLEQAQARVGRDLLLTLQWQVTSRVPVDYTLFNQVIGPENKMLGQLDTAPSCTAGPTSKWKPGEIISGYYQIPIFADAMPGSYPLVVGLYQPENGERLPVSAPDGAVTDVVHLANITIAP
ncbi:MAG: hypothetical protein NT075_25200 [Chloroflexi bacterium]|nr:hypothetical protein [Chloroflexota bacterium]